MSKKEVSPVAHHPVVQQQDTQQAINKMMSLNLRTPLQQAQEEWSRILISVPVANERGKKESSRSIPASLSPQNQMNNCPWGDRLTKDKPDHVLRIYCQNVNGFKISDEDGGNFREFCEVHLMETKANIICGQEHNTDTTQSKVRKKLHDVARRHFDRVIITTSSSPIPFTGTYKPGGTFIISNGGVTGRVVERMSDKWGRWSTHILTGRDEQRLAVISAYQVVDMSASVLGTSTSSAQQRSLLISTNDPITDPRKAFRRDLSQYIHLLRSNNNEILLVGDFNESFGEDTNGMTSMAAANGLQDLIKNHHKHLEDSFATFARGTKRLDYALGSARVALAIQKAGYEPFNERFCSDHRGFFIDLDAASILSSEIQPMAPIIARGIRSNNVKQVTQYLRAKHQLLTAENVFERASKLQLPGDRHELAEIVDQDILRLSLVAEKRTQKFKEPSWSQELHQQRLIVKALSKILSMSKTGIDLSTQIEHDFDRMDIPIAIPRSQKDCSIALREAKSAVRAIVKNSFTTRAKERDKIIESLSLSQEPNDKKKVTILRQLKRGEEVREMFRKLKYLRNPARNQGITRIEIPLDPFCEPGKCNQWQEIDVPSDILMHLQERNKSHFGQASGTPFTIPPLSDDLQFHGNTTSGQEILDGEYESTALPEAVQVLLAHLAYIDKAQRVRSVSEAISDQEFSEKLQHWRESTSTSPSGLHLGHYRSMIARHEYSEEDAEHEGRIEMDRIQTDIRALHLNVLNYALTRGYSYSRWGKVVNAMLFKEQQNIKIHRTRVIHLYEADYNLAMGLKWRAALFHCEHANLLNEGQYGSRPNRNAQDPVFIEEFQYEISRVSRKTFVHTSFDAASCYDRIVPNLAGLVSQKYGVHKSVVQSNINTLHTARYHLKTELGVSDTFYQHSNRHPIYGTGQGSGNSPVIWCFLSSTLFDCFAIKAAGSQYQYPDRTKGFTVHMTGYVDDCNSQINQFEEKVQPKMGFFIKKARCDVQLWNDTLSASGGALELSKCSIQAMSWLFAKNGAPVLQPGDVTMQAVQLKDENGNIKCIVGLSAYESHKTLGHYKDPAGNQRAQARSLSDKCTKSAEFLQNSFLTREESWTYYQSIFLPGIGYPLASSHFKKDTLDQIQSKAMNLILSRCGYNQKTKRLVLYGPTKLGGGGFWSLYTIQSTGQLSYFLKYWRSEHSQAGRLLRTAVTWTQFALGISKSFLEDVETTLPHIESMWLNSLRSYLKLIRGTLELDCLVIPKLQRQNDSYIMDNVIQSKQFSATEICQINYCRLFLDVVTVSDLSDASGKWLNKGMLLGKQDVQSSISTWNGIHQETPSEVQWRLWRKVNLLWGSRDGKLHQSMGRWTIENLDSRRRWPAYWDPKERNIYYADLRGECQTPGGKQSQNMSYKLYLSKSESKEYRVQPGSYNMRSMGKHLYPIDVQVVSTECIIPHQIQTSQRSVFLRMPTGYLTTDFTSFVNSLATWESEILQHVTLKYDAYSTARMLSQNVFSSASDGSVRHRTNGSFGWAISLNNGERLVTAMGPVRGKFPSSYRAEGYGMLSVIRFLIRLKEYCNIDEPWDCEIACDNESLVKAVITEETETQEEWRQWTTTDQSDSEAIQNIIHSNSPNLTLTPEWDIINEIKFSVEQLRAKVRISHVLGHQDRHQKYHKLPLLAQLNCDADAMASTFQDQFGEPRERVLLFPHTGAHLHLGNSTITSSLFIQLRTAETGPPLEEYLRERNKWGNTCFRQIDWDAHASFLKKHRSQRIHLCKHLHEVLPVNSNVHRHGTETQKLCPLCKCVPEDRDHVFQCDHRSRRKWREQFVLDFATHCSNRRTRPGMARVLLDGIKTWMNQQSLTGLAIGDDQATEYHSAIRAQNDIGWRHIFSGRWASQWARLQDDYLAQSDHFGIKSTGQQWVVNAMTVCWTAWRDVWSQRNQTVHGHDAFSRNKAIREQRLRSLDALYQKREQMEPSVQDFFFPTFEEHASMSTNAITNWLNIHEHIALRSIKTVQRRALTGVKSMKTYFTVKQKETSTRNIDERKERPVHQKNNTGTGAKGEKTGYRKGSKKKIRRTHDPPSDPLEEMRSIRWHMQPTQQSASITSSVTISVRPEHRNTVQLTIPKVRADIIDRSKATRKKLSTDHSVVATHSGSDVHHFFDKNEPPPRIEKSGNNETRKVRSDDTKKSPSPPACF